MNESFEYYASKLLSPELHVLVVEAGAIIDQYNTGTNNVFYHILFLLFMAVRVSWFFWSKWRKKKRNDIEIENAELEKNNNILNQKIKLEQLLLLEKFNKQDTAEEQLNKFKRKREWLEENIKKNEKH